MDFTSRVPDEVGERLMELARENHGVSRNALLKLLLIDYIKIAPFPVRRGEGLKAVREGSPTVYLRWGYEKPVNVKFDSDDGKDKKFMTLVGEARSLARRGFWSHAKRVLLDAGFEVTLIPRK
ncbi:MAG: hypothetical protein GY805_11220 [Chloroflexi bacterium]|nr:hypothetical protein [Chloroflexota bacterium]